MQENTFENIKKAVLSWYELCISSGKGYMQLVKNEDEFIIIDLTFDHCLAQISVYHAYWAPFKNISFEALTAESKKVEESGQPELIYFFYDSDNTTIKDIISALDAGVEYCLKYTPDFLRTRYINKNGVIRLRGEKVNSVIHPDDLTKINKICFEDRYTCVDVQFQYLVIESDVLSFRILPQYFDCI